MKTTKHKEQIKEFEKKFTMEVKLPGEKRIRSISGISADWKEVKKWLSKALDKYQQATIEEIIEKLEKLKKAEYYKFYINKSPETRKHKVYLKSDMDFLIDQAIKSIK